MEYNDDLNHKFYEILRKNALIVDELSRFLTEIKDIKFKPFIFDFYDDVKVKVTPTKIAVGEYGKNCFKNKNSLYFEIVPFGVKHNQIFEDLKENEVNKLKNKFDLLKQYMNFLISKILINFVVNNNESDKKS